MDTYTYMCVDDRVAPEDRDKSSAKFKEVRFVCGFRHMLPLMRLSHVVLKKGGGERERG
jgi:hypothetical protein